MTTTSTLSKAELRDLTKMDTVAGEIMQQTAHLRRNMQRSNTHDRSRIMLIRSKVRRLDEIVGRFERRLKKLEKAGGY